MRPRVGIDIGIGDSAELLPKANTVKYAATVGAAPACGRGEANAAWSESGAGRSFRLCRLFRGHARRSRCSDSLFLNFQRFVHADIHTRCG
jgi:hypothetical protein